jgi:long-subunit fatty acid transport protein
VLPGKCALGALACVALTGTAHASTMDLFGFGGRSPALAGTGLASSTDYEATFLDPAGLADARRRGATVGFLYGNFDLQLAGQKADVSPARGSIIGGVVPMPLGGVLRDRVGLGFGFYVPLDTLNKAKAPFPGDPSFALLANRSQVIAIQLGLGYRIDDRWSVGVGVIALAALKGTISVTSDPAGRFTTFSEEKLVTQLAPVVGGRWHRPGGTLAIGATLRMPSRSDYDIEVTSDLGSAVPVALPPIRIAGNAQYDPLTLAVEAAWQWQPDVLLSAQLAYQRWSPFPLPTENPVPSTPAQGPTGFHDTAVPRISIEHTRTLGGAHVALRAGYAFLWSPAPEQTGRQSLLDNDRHLGSIGLGVAWPDSSIPLRLDAWGQAQYLMFRANRKDPGLFGPGQMIPFDEASTRGHILAAGLTVGVDL